MFTVAGLSRQNGTLKLRFANDFVTRIKVLGRNGHKDIDLVELPQAMTKDAAVAYLSTLDTFKGVEAQSVFADYQSKNVKTASKGKELEVEVEFESAEAKAKRERDAARKREARAAAKTAELA
ncbi:MAG: hypothetical protein ACKOPU_00745 [Candidatus Planktophila sp.]